MAEKITSLLSVSRWPPEFERIKRCSEFIEHGGIFFKIALLAPT